MGILSLAWYCKRAAPPCDGTAVRPGRYIEHECASNGLCGPGWQAAETSITIVAAVESLKRLQVQKSVQAWTWAG